MRLKKASEIRSSIVVQPTCQFNVIADAIEEVKKFQNFILWGHSNPDLVETVLKELKNFEYTIEPHDAGDSDYPLYKIMW